MYKIVVLTLLFTASIVRIVDAQQELIDPQPEERGNLRSWTEPNLLPDKYVAKLRYEPITYGRDGVAPLPALAGGFKVVDWDNSGKAGILANVFPYHGGKPYLIYYKNIGDKQPLFTTQSESQIVLESDSLGSYFDLIDLNDDGKQEIITFDGRKTLLAFVNEGDTKQPQWKPLTITDDEAQPWAHIQDVKGTPPITAVDWDQDGRTDLLIGANHPSIMKHDFGTNPEEMHPDAFRIYFVKNITQDASQPRFARPEVLTENGEPLKFLGWAYPLAYDVDHDGLPDLVSGEHRPGIRIFKNVGQKGAPKLKYVGLMRNQDNQAIESAIAFHLEAGDINGDQINELVSITQFSAVSYYYPIYPPLKAGQPVNIGWEMKDFLMMPCTPETPLYGPAICTVDPVDWDQDGDTDILAGAEPGMPVVFINTGTEDDRKFANPQRLKFYDGRPLETYSIEMGDGSSHGAWEWYDDRSTPTLADWDGDGTKDIVSGTQGRRLYWMKGKSLDGELRFGPPSLFTIRGTTFIHPHRTKPAVVDWDQDGMMDLIALNNNSELTIYLGQQTSDLSVTGIVPLKTTQGTDLVSDFYYINPPMSLSLSGRTGIAVTDWDNDGRQDIITHKHRGSVLYYRNAGDPKNNVFDPARVLFDFDSHLAGPAVMDWDNDGYLDILMAGDRKRISGEKSWKPEPIRAQFMYYKGESLPFPPAKR